MTTIKDFDISNDLFSFMKQEQINKDILLLVDDLVKIGFIEKTLFQEDMNQLMRTISNNGLTCSIKPHPFNPQLYGNMKNQKHILPGFIPANYFIISNHWKYIIGLITTALFDAQDQTDAEIICVIDCLHWKNDRDRQHMKNWLLKHNKRILFPRGWDEFDKLLG